MIEHLSELYIYVLPMHKGLMHLLLMLVVIYFLLTQFGVKTKNYVLRIRYFLPIYHAVLAVCIFSGLLLLTALSFDLNFKISRMIIAIFALIAISAIGFKRLKRYAPVKELDKFKKFALIQSVVEIALILFAGL